MNQKRLILLVSAMVVMAAMPALAGMLIELDEPYVGELKVVGFELDQDAEVEIEAMGLLSGYQDNLIVNAWIIDHETREPVWTMKNRWRDRSNRRKATIEVETTKDFDAGKYELYLFAGSSNFQSITINGLGDIFDVLEGAFDGDDRGRFIDDDIEDCFVRLSSSDISERDFSTFEVDGKLPGSLMRFTQLEDSEYIEAGFTMKSDGKLRIYSILEFPDGNREPVDYGWITDADSREKVWEIDRWNTDDAGGGKKNQLHDEEISLSAGNYILYFVTDDSHSFESFNVSPPYDPLNWGITILPGRGFDPDDFVEYEVPSKGEPLIDFTRARNSEYYEQGFSLSKNATLHIYAIGEMGLSSRSFADFGSIIDASSGKTVWEMTRRNTDHAGGNQKNRLFDGTVDLPKGKYIATYVTDDSHAYRSFNASPPIQPKAYGMAVYPANGSDKGGFKLVDVEELGLENGMLVNITRVRDSQRKRQTFNLDQDSWINIYALGEGERNDMYDYAYIVSKGTGRDVWEMTWRNTYHAGGARKNRVYDDEVFLKAGEYEVIYITDGSHSFNDWNQERPDDPHNWGIKISLAEK